MVYASTKIQNLIVRACKSKNPQKRLVTLYKKFYHNEFENEVELQLMTMNVMTNIMMFIIDEYKLSNLYEFYNEVSGMCCLEKLRGFDSCSGNDTVFNNYLFASYKTAISIIRFSKVSKYNDQFKFNTKRFKK